MTKILLAFSFFYFFCTSLFAQRIQPETAQWLNSVQIDGKLNEWGDSLAYYFEDQDLQYSIANNNEFLYIAIRVKDKQKQIQACFNGFNIMINSLGKKKEGPSVIFPIPNEAALRALKTLEKKTNDIRTSTLDAVRAIHINGFPEILDGSISLENNYGIKTMVLIDSADNLCYESAISLAQLRLTDQEKPFAINVKINGIIKSTYTDSGRRPMSRRGRYPYGYGGYGNYPRTSTSSREEPGIWKLFTLATGL